MAKRHRRRARGSGNKPNPKPHPVQILHASGTLVATAPPMQRLGLDTAIIMAIQAVDDLIKDMRNGVIYPSSPENEDDAVKRYLLYISILVDVVLPDIIMSAIAGHDHMVEMKQRILLEYAAKAAYFNDHPDYALYMMTINEAEQVLRKLTQGKSEPEAIARAARHVDDMRAAYPHLTEITKKSFNDIFSAYAEKDDYVWLYGAPSALLHGDPEGMRIVIEQQSDGKQIPHLTLPLNQVNALLVDTGRNALLFCDKFIDRFRSKEEAFTKRVVMLNRVFLGLILQHHSGRSEQVLEAVRKQIADIDAAEKTA